MASRSRYNSHVRSEKDSPRLATLPRQTGFGGDDFGQDQMVNIITTRVGVYGWRKYCLYCSVLLVTCLAIINLGLLVYMLRVMRISKDSAGPLKFHSDRLTIDGDAEFTRGLVINKLSSFNDTDLILQSNTAVSLRSAANNSQSSCSINPSGFNCQSDSFKFSSQDSSMSFTKDATTFTSPEVIIASESGLTIEGGLQTNRISNTHASGQGLTIESIGQSLNMQASRDINLESTQGDISLESLLGIQLNSASNIVLSGAQIIFQDLPTIPAHANAASFSLCACLDGKLFRVDSSESCDVGAIDLC